MKGRRRQLRIGSTLRFDATGAVEIVPVAAVQPIGVAALPSPLDETTAPAVAATDARDAENELIELNRIILNKQEEILTALKGGLMET